MTRVIDPKVEQATRDMLGHAIRGELQDLATLIHAVGDATYKQALGMCVTAAAYIAVDVSGRWPTDADLHQIARNTAREETRLDLEEDDIYDYLSGAAFGYKQLAEALGSDEAAATLPVLITGSMIITLCPRDKEWWEYLDQIWNATLTAENLDDSVLPAVQIRIHRTQLLKDRDTASQ
jgi:hypothetical protein